MPRVVMVKTAAGPEGVFRAGLTYTVSPKMFEEFTAGEDPAAVDASDAPELGVESRGEVPEGDTEPTPESKAEAAKKTASKKKRASRKKAR